MQDFLKSVNEIKPEYGIDNEKILPLVNQRIIDCGKRFSKIMENGLKILGEVKEGSLKSASILLYGHSGSGTTTIAANLANEAKYPYIKMITADDLVGKSDHYKTNFIIKCFDDAYKSK